MCRRRFVHVACDFFFVLKRGEELLLTERLEIAIRTFVFNLRLGEVDIRMEDFVQEVLESFSEILFIQTVICYL